MAFKEIPAGELALHPFSAIDKGWMLVTAQKDGVPNTMTASWGGLGTMWGLPCAFVFIRPQRYTKEFVDGSDTLSLTFFDESFRKQLSYLGTISGRDEPKIQKAGLTVARDGDTPYFNEANTVLLCRKLLAQELRPQNIVDKEVIKKWHPFSDFHTLYIVEVTKVLVNEG